VQPAADSSASTCDQCEVKASTVEQFGQPSAVHVDVLNQLNIRDV